MNTVLIRYTDGYRVIQERESSSHAWAHRLSREEDVDYVIYDCGNMCKENRVEPHIDRGGRRVRIT